MGKLRVNSVVYIKPLNLYVVELEFEPTLFYSLSFGLSSLQIFHTQDEGLNFISHDWDLTQPELTVSYSGL